MISSDVNILKNYSETRKRMIDYGSLFDGLDIILLCKKSDGGKSVLKISENTRVFLTLSKNKLFYIWDAYKISKKIQNAPDFVYPQDPFEMGLLGYFLAKKFKSKFFPQIHTDFLSKHFKKESLKNRLRAFLAKIILKKADKIRVVSEKIKKSLISLNLKADIIVLPIFVDVFKIKEAKIKSNLKKKYPEFDFIILMASRLTKEKNISLAILAMKDLVKKYKNLGLVIVGDGPEREKLEKLIDRLELFSNVKLEGWSLDLPSYYKTADLFLLTSFYEGYGRTIVEALSANTYVLSTNVGVASELGVCIFDGSKDDLVKKIGLMVNSICKKDLSFDYIYKSKKDYLDKFKEQFLD